MLRQRYEGGLRALHGDLVVGWARSLTQPDERVVVEVLCDGYSVALATAEVFDSELRDRGMGDGCHAFVVPLPARSVATGARITARVANDGTPLHGALAPLRDRSASAPPSRGEVRSDGGLRLTGWLWDSSQPDRHVALRVFEGDRLVIETIANERRAELVAAHMGAGDHGFTLWLPLEFADGKPHHLRIIDEEGREVAGSPIVVLASAPGASALLRRTLSDLEERLAPEAVHTLAMVEKHLRAYERLLPRSAGFADYAAWYQAFQLPPAPVLPGQGSVDGHSPGRAIPVVLWIHGVGDAGRTLRSLQEQTHMAWTAFVEAEVTASMRSDSRVRAFSSVALHTACRANGVSDGSILVPVRAGDRLPSHALARLATAFRDPTVAVVYTDCDHDAGDGSPTDPWFKPAWDPDLFLSQDYLLDLLAVRCALLGTRDVAVDVADLPFLAMEAALADGGRIHHLAEVLCHRCGDLRSGQGSIPSEKSLAALRRHLTRVEPAATAEPLPGAPWLRRVYRPAPQRPLVSILIPTKDKLDLLEPCVSSILERTTYPHFEILIIDNHSSEPETLRYFDEISAKGVRILPYPHRFNYAAINNVAVEEAKGSLVCLLNNDVEVITPDWLDEMVSLLLRPGVGAVGAKLLWPTGMVQHGGVVIGVGGLAAHAFNHVGADDLGYAGRAAVTQRYSAVTAACLLCRKADYQAVGGMDAAEFPVAFNDVDFCLKLGAAGLSIVWTPFAQLFHYESASRGAEDTPEKAARATMEMAALRRRWAAILADDPCYNPNLNLDGMPFSSLALPPRWPRCVPPHQ